MKIQKKKKKKQKKTRDWVYRLKQKYITIF